MYVYTNQLCQNAYFHITAVVQMIQQKTFTRATLCRHSRRHKRKMALGDYMRGVSASTGLAEEIHQITTQNFGR